MRIHIDEKFSDVGNTGRPLVKAYLLIHTRESILVRNSLNMMNVEKSSDIVHHLVSIIELTLGRNLVFVINVRKPSARTLA
jgi:hypothetical protein